MALCECGRNWRWDWCQDTYCYDDGREVKNYDFTQENENLGFEVKAYECLCGKVNSVFVSHPDVGGVPLNRLGLWENVQWEENEHSLNN